MKKIFRNKGFSLAEMMIVMLIVSIVLAVSGPMLAKREEKILTGSVPAGTIITYAGAITILKPIPTGWLLCDGRAISRADYSALFNAIGTTYGAGNGSTTFNLPDLRGRVAVGMDNMGGTSADRITASTADTLGGSGGEELHTLSTSEMPAHSHGGATNTSSAVSGTSGAAGGHSHTSFSINIHGGRAWGWGYVNGSNSSPRSANTSSYPDHTHTITVPSHTHGINPEGSSSAHNNVPPYMAINYIIKF
jgi:prepilin-type N-terminal cleavage/methylation domain-containing protein